MSAVRTQIYLTTEQRQQIDRIAAVEGSTMADVIRRALDNFLADVAPDPTAALRTTFGALADVATPSRDEWDRG